MKSELEFLQTEYKLCIYHLEGSRNKQERDMWLHTLSEICKELDKLESKI